MSRRTGTIVAAIVVWLAIVGSTSTVAWVAIDHAGRGAYASGGAQPELTQSGQRTNAEPTPGGTTSPVPGTPSPTGTAKPSRTSPATRTTPAQPPSPTTPAGSRPPSSTSTNPAAPSSQSSTPGSTGAPSSPRPAVVSDSVSVIGGSVGVSCQGSRLTLRFATPRNGWAYTIDRSSTAVEVSFRQNGGEGEAEVHARCVSGAPAFETGSSDGSGGDGDG